MSCNCFPTLVLRKLMRLPRNMQVWARIFFKWTLLWVNVSILLSMDGMENFILSGSNFHLSYLLFVTCFWWTRLQGWCFFPLDARSNIFQGEFAVPPGFHGTDFPFYFPESFVFFYLLLLLGFHFTNPREHINITTFGESFSESFLNFVLRLNPNIKWDPSDITPTWELWNGNTEMLFNVTEAGDPDIRAVKTSSALLERCEWVC